MEKTAGKQELYGSAYLQERHHRFPALSQRREEEEGSADSRLARGGRAVRTGFRRSVSTKGATLKYRPPYHPSSSSSLVIDSFATRSILQTGRIWGGGRQGRRGRKASPLVGLIQSPIPSRLGTCLSVHEDDSAASPGDFVPRSTFHSRDPNSEIILRLLAAWSERQQ